MKTLIGKNGYLFLQNDTTREIESHIYNKTNVKNYSCIKKDNYLLTVFPNKSFILQNFLPDGYTLQFRSAFDKYNEVLQEHILDGFVILKEIPNIFYKTDTHINLKGAYEVYRHFIDKINLLFNLNIEKKEIIIQKKECVLSNLKLGLGDLTWKENKGEQIVDDLIDTYYFSKELPQVLGTKITTTSNLRILDYELVDINDTLEGNIITWNIVSKNILYMKNINKEHKVLIFYDSFLLSTLFLYLEMFEEVYLIKTIYNQNLINLIKPDYTFEFRVERFLR